MGTEWPVAADLSSLDPLCSVKKKKKEGASVNEGLGERE